MVQTAYKEDVNPYRLDKEMFGALSGPGFGGYGGNGDKPGDVIPYPERLITILRRRYAFRDLSAVKGFLEEHPFLIQVLFTAYKEIRDVFGPGPRLALRVVADPEALEERELFLFIQTTLHPRAARPLLDELSRKWWLDAMLDAKGEMNISLEYV